MEYRRASSLVTKAEMQLTPLGHRLIARICECSAPEHMTDEETIEKIKMIRMSFGRGALDDDVFLYARSPFDDKWYYFAAGITGPYSEDPMITGVDLANPDNALSSRLIQFHIMSTWRNPRKVARSFKFGIQNNKEA